jgi:hypothetical protein
MNGMPKCGADIAGSTTTVACRNSGMRSTWLRKH